MRVHGSMTAPAVAGDPPPDDQSNEPSTEPASDTRPNEESPTVGDVNTSKQTAYPKGIIDASFLTFLL